MSSSIMTMYDILPVFLPFIFTYRNQFTFENQDIIDEDAIIARLFILVYIFISLCLYSNTIAFQCQELPLYFISITYHLILAILALSRQTNRYNNFNYKIVTQKTIKTILSTKQQLFINQYTTINSKNINNKQILPAQNIQLGNQQKVKQCQNSQLQQQIQIQKLVMSAQIASIREKFRQEIRAKQIKQFMELVRAKHINQTQLPSSIFSKLDNKIRQSATKPINMGLIQQLIKVLQQHPDDDNTYLIIGNYLARHPGAEVYFHVRVLGLSGIARKLQNYHRLVLIMLFNIQEVGVGILEEFDRTIAEIIQVADQGMLAHCLKTFQLVLNFDTIYKNKKFFPVHSMMSYFQKVQTKDLLSLKPQTPIIMVQIACSICNLFMDSQNKFIAKHMGQLIKIITYGLDHLPYYRQQLLYQLNRLSINFIAEFEQCFCTNSGRQCFKQLLYLCDNAPLLLQRAIIIISNMVQQFSFDILQIFLNIGLHTILVKILCKQQANSPQSVYQILKILLMLLRRVQDKQQQHMLYKLLDQIDYAGFDGFLKQFMMVRRNQEIQAVCAEIVDSYYSDQVSQ